MKELFEKIAKEYGNVLNIGETFPNITKIPTRIFTFDLLVGGGLPVNKFTTLWGTKSSGKTTFSFKIIDSFLKTFSQDYVVYIDFEHALNKEWMSNFVSDMKRVVIISPDYGEQGVDLAYQMSLEPAVCLIVIDSLPAIISISEVESDSEDSQVAGSARLIRKMLNKLLVSMANAQKEKRPLTCVLINQARANVGARKFESKIRMPGGYVVEHLSYLIVHLYLSKYETKGDIPYRAVHQFTIEKNKAGYPRISGEFKIDIQQGRIVDENLILKFALDLGIINRNKSSYEYAGNKYKTQKEIEKILMEDLEFRDNLVNQIINKWWEERK